MEGKKFPSVVFCYLLPNSNFMCTKRSYNSEREAREVLNAVKTYRVYNYGKRVNKRVGKKDKRPRRAYRCPDCGLWHLTSQIKHSEER